MGDNESIARYEFNEFKNVVAAKMEGLEKEDNRQNKRLENLESDMKELGRLTISVEKMAQSIQQMADELKAQGERLGMLETAPYKRINTVVTAALGIILGGAGTLLITSLINTLK